MAGTISETEDLKYEPPFSPFYFMTNHILIFSDHRGNQRFFLRFGGTADELHQIWLERWADHSKRDTDWATITWEHGA
jgi:hypothetical protein